MSSDLIQICEDFIIKLSKIEDIADKKTELFQADEVIDALLDLKVTTPSQFESIIDRIGEQFHRSKTNTIKSLNDILANKQKEKTKKNIGEFSDVDFEKLVAKNGVILPTPSNNYEILLAAKTIGLCYDTMAANAYFDKMSWEPKTPAYTIEYYGGVVKHYYKYREDNETMLKIALNKGPFPTEVNFKSLDDVVTEVAKERTFDAYSDWTDSYKSALDGVDYINGHDDNFAVKYMGVSPGPWSAIWCRALMVNLVARCKNPGCLTRFYFVIEGEQFTGKSTFCRLLVPAQWFIATGLTQAQSNEDNFNRSIHDKAVVELAELGGFHRNETNLVKKIVTDPYATFRKMRQDPVIQYPKHCIMIVTTNDAKYLRDPTGETRAMPIKTELKTGQFMNLEGFAKVYPMILAQAIHIYEQDERLRFLNDEEQILQKEQTSTRDTIDDTWEFENIVEYIETRRDHFNEFGISYKDITEHWRTKYEMPLHALIRHRNNIGIVIRKLGYTELIVAKEKDEDGIWRSVKRWRKPSR